MTTRIGINGFGRIGRLVQRQATRRGDFEIALVPPGPGLFRQEVGFGKNTVSQRRK